METSKWRSTVKHKGQKTEVWEYTVFTATHGTPRSENVSPDKCFAWFSIDCQKKKLKSQYRRP